MEPNYLKIAELQLGGYYRCRLSDRPVVVVNLYERSDGFHAYIKVFVEGRGYVVENVSDHQLY